MRHRAEVRDTDHGLHHLLGLDGAQRGEEPSWDQREEDRVAPSQTLPQPFQCRLEQRPNLRISLSLSGRQPLPTHAGPTPGRAARLLASTQRPATPPTKRTCGFYGHLGPGDRGFHGLEAQRLTEGRVNWARPRAS